MKNSRDMIIKGFLCNQTKTKLEKEERKLYLVFLHEDLYSLVSKNQAKIKFIKKNTKTDQKKSFLRTKRSISLLRSNNFFFIKKKLFDEKREISLQFEKKFFLSIFLESFVFVLLINYEKKTSKKLLSRLKFMSSSVHKPLEFLEKQWQSNYFSLKNSFGYLFHCEILIRMLRKNVEDISFLHFLRQFLHFDLSLQQREKTFFLLKEIKNIFWNIYVLEIDRFFFSKAKSFCSIDNQNYGTLNLSLSCLQKNKDWNYFLEKRKYKSLVSQNFNKIVFFPTKFENFFVFKCTTYKYLRANTIWLCFYQKGISWFPIIENQLLFFLNQRFGLIVKKNKKKLNLTFFEAISFFNSYVSNFSKINVLQLKPRENLGNLFLAYHLEGRKKRILIRINTRLFLLENTLKKHFVCFVNPFLLILISLEKQNFCNNNGYPQAKSGWITWDDTEIIEQFHRIWNTFLLFYSGCQNRKSLSRIRYILKYSCAKTLASKHKTNIRNISKKFGMNLKIKNRFSVKKKSKVTQIKFFQTRERLNRIWNLQLTHFDSQLFQLNSFF